MELHGAENEQVRKKTKRKKTQLAGGSSVRKAEALERETQVHQKVKVTNREKKKKIQC